MARGARRNALTFGEVAAAPSALEPESADCGGLHPHPRHDPELGPVPDPIPWSSITRIDRRGNSAGAGAGIGGLALALFSGISVGAFDGSGASGLEGGLVFLSLVAGAGAGGLLGALIPAWHKVIPRPEAAQRRLELR